MEIKFVQVAKNKVYKTAKTTKWAALRRDRTRQGESE